MMMFNNVLPVLVLILCIQCCCVAGSALEERELYKVLFAGYNSHVRPVINSNDTVHVKTTFRITTIKELNSQNQVMDVMGFLENSWMDQYLTWNPADWNNIQSIAVPPGDVWLPDIIIKNSASTVFDELSSKLFRVIIFHTGYLFWVFGGIISVTCKVDLTYFPFDKQMCELQIKVWSYTSDTVYFQLSNNESEYHVMENAEWHLMYTEAVLETPKFSSYSERNLYPQGNFRMYVQRKPGYYILNLMIPCCLMTVLTLFMYWLPPSSGEKISLGVTVLLSFSVLQLSVADMTPVNSDTVPMISIYIIFVMCMCAMSCVNVIMIQYIYHRGGHHIMSAKVKSVFLATLAKLLFLPVITREQHYGSKELQESEERREKTETPKQERELPFEFIELRQDLKYIRAQLERREQCMTSQSEWHALALVLERLSFVVCLTATLIATMMVVIGSQV